MVLVMAARSVRRKRVQRIRGEGWIMLMMKAVSVMTLPVMKLVMPRRRTRTPVTDET